MTDFVFFGMCCMDILVYVREHPKEDTDQRALFQRWARGGNASNNATVFSMLLRNEEILGEIQAASITTSNTSVDQAFSAPEIFYLGALGGDFWAKFLKEDFIDHGINIDAIEEYSECASPVANCIVNVEKGHRSIISFSRDLPSMTSQAIRMFSLEKLKWIHFEGRNVDCVLEMIQYIRQNDVERRIVISVDLEKEKPFVQNLLTEDIDIYIIEKEFGRVFGIDTPERMLNEMPLKIANPNALIAFPWGSQGAFGFNKRNGQRYSSKSFPPTGNFIDTLGAGDSFTSAFIFGVGMLNYRLDRALEFACRVAGAKCSAAGFQHLQDSKHLLVN